MLLGELQLLGLDHQLAVLVPDHDRLLVRAPHIDPLDQGLAADGGAETALAVGLIVSLRHR